MKYNKIYNENCLETMARMPNDFVDSIVTDPPYGLSFMGKKWDYDVPSVEIWKECLRVLKPGGHLLSFAGTRTQHRMAVNIEDAGFEIRDMIAWIYGSGFPKSHNIGKAVDKIQGNEREKSPNPLAKKQTGQKNTNALNGDRNSNDTLSKGFSAHEGWGTALKPALEPITLARKPLSERTIAANVLKWGTGGLNIDGCRVGMEKVVSLPSKSTNKYAQDEWSKNNPIGERKENVGRFPANLIHDGSQQVLDLFPETKSGSHKAGQPTSYVMPNVTTYTNDATSGSASRFFYCAKASKRDRNEGLEGFEEKYENRGNGFSKKISDTKLARANNHPTVKPTPLMQYLIRLITPPDGIVYDPFTGSGSTLKACVLEGFNFIGSELEEEYCKIAEARINTYTTPPL